MITLKSLKDLERITNHLSRIAATQCLTSLVRDYNELDEATVEQVKDRVLAAYNRNWVGEKRSKFWGDALMLVHRFWGEHFNKGDDLAKQSVAFPILAKFFTENEVRNAWNAAVIGCIERAEFADCAIYESIDSGHKLVITLEGKEYFVSPAGIEDLTDVTFEGENISHEFSMGPHFREVVGAEAYVDAAVDNDNYYYRALAVYVGLLEELDGEISTVYDTLVPTLETQRKRQCAIEALLIARCPNSNLGYAAAGLSAAPSLLISANFGSSKRISNVFVQSVPCDVPNHRFIANYALSELARKLKERGYDVSKHAYPELVALVSGLAIQVVPQGDNPKTIPLLRWNEPLCDKFADLIYGLGESVKASAAVVADAKEFRPLVEDAAKILTVVFKNQIRC